MPYVEAWADESDVDVSVQGLLDDPVKRLELTVALRNMGYAVESA